jgi:hypothetical protein
MANSRAGKGSGRRSSASHFGGTADRIRALHEERQSIAAEIRTLIEAGGRLLEEMGRDAGDKIADVVLPRPGRRRTLPQLPAAVVAPARASRKPRGTLSAAGRARIAAAQRKRWAAYRAGKKN